MRLKLRHILLALTLAIGLPLLIGAILAGNVSAAGYASQWQLFGDPPEDSVRAEQVRIWIANETGKPQRFNVDIFDHGGKRIRHFVQSTINPGYINLYWDRKDDDGRWVEPGKFWYYSKIRTDTTTGTLYADFEPEERLVQVQFEDPNRPGVIKYDVLADSLSITIGVYLWKGRAVTQPITDSIHSRGSYEFVWQHPEQTHQAMYAFILKAAGIKHKVPITRVVEDEK